MHHLPICCADSACSSSGAPVASPPPRAAVASSRTEATRSDPDGQCGDSLHRPRSVDRHRQHRGCWSPLGCCLPRFQVLPRVSADVVGMTVTSRIHNKTKTHRDAPHNSIGGFVRAALSIVRFLFGYVWLGRVVAGTTYFSTMRSTGLGWLNCTL